MQPKDVDKIVQDALKNYKPEFREEFWDDMEAALDAAEKQPAKNRRNAFLMLFTTLLVALTAIGVLLMKDSSMTELAQNRANLKSLEQQKVNSIAGKSEVSAEKNAASFDDDNETSLNSINEIDRNVNAAGIDEDANVTALKAGNKYLNTNLNSAPKKAFSKNAETGYFAKNNKIIPVKNDIEAVTSNKNDLAGNSSINVGNNKLAQNDVKPDISSEKTITEEFADKEINKSGIDLIVNNKVENSLIALSEVPAILAERNMELPAAKVQENEELLASGKQNSMALNELEEKKKHAASSANWQSVLYNFRDNSAYTGNEAKYNFNVDTRHIAYEGYGALESRYNFSFDTRLEKLRSSIGIYHQRNLRSLSFATTTGLTYAYNINTDPNGHLRLGAGISMQDKSLYINSIKYNDQIMPGYGFIWTTNENFVAPKSTSYSGDAGIWYQRPKWMAGVSAKNLFYKPGNHEVSSPPIKYIIAAGYRFDLGKNLTLMPWGELHLYDPLYWIHSNLLLTWKDKLMVGTAYQNMNPWVGYGDISIFAGYEFKNRLRVHASVGRSSEWLMYSGVKQDIFQAGLRYRIK